MAEADLCKLVGKLHLAISTGLSKLDQKMTDMNAAQVYARLTQLLKALPPPAGASNGPRLNTIEVSEPISTLRFL
jgi:hypothetical protein